MDTKLHSPHPAPLPFHLVTTPQPAGAKLMHNISALPEPSRSGVECFL